MVCVMTFGLYHMIGKMLDEMLNILDSITNIYLLIVDPYVSSILTLCSLVLKRRDMLCAVQYLNDIDKIVKKLGLQPPMLVLTIAGKIGLGALPVGFITWLVYIYSIDPEYNILENVLDRLCFMPCYIMYNYLMYCSIGQLIFVYERFLLLNKKVRSMGNESPSKIRKQLPNIGMVHFYLCQSTKQITGVYSTAIISLTVKVYITTLVCLLSFYGITPVLQAEIFIWMGVYGSMYISLVTFCEITANEVIQYLWL